MAEFFGRAQFGQGFEPKFHQKPLGGLVAQGMAAGFGSSGGGNQFAPQQGADGIAVLDTAQLLDFGRRQWLFQGDDSDGFEGRARERGRGRRFSKTSRSDS